MSICSSNIDENYNLRILCYKFSKFKDLRHRLIVKIKCPITEFSYSQNKNCFKILLVNILYLFEECSFVFDNIQPLIDKLKRWNTSCVETCIIRLRNQNNMIHHLSTSTTTMDD